MDPEMKNIRLLENLPAIPVTRVMVLKLVGQRCKGVAWSISICRATASNGYYSCIARTIKTSSRLPTGRTAYQRKWNRESDLHLHHASIVSNVSYYTSKSGVSLVHVLFKFEVYRRYL